MTQNTLLDVVNELLITGRLQEGHVTMQHTNW